MAVPPLAETPRLVLLETEPPSTDTPPTVSPTPMALPTLPPLLMSPRLTAPPLAPAVATPPLPADAVNCAKSSSLILDTLPDAHPGNYRPDPSGDHVPNRLGGFQGTLF